MTQVVTAIIQRASDGKLLLVKRSEQVSACICVHQRHQAEQAAPWRPSVQCIGGCVCV